jgi:hypothetical protein
MFVFASMLCNNLQGGDMKVETFDNIANNIWISSYYTTNMQTKALYQFQRRTCTKLTVNPLRESNVFNWLFRRHHSNYLSEDKGVDPGILFYVFCNKSEIYIDQSTGAYIA